MCFDDINTWRANPKKDGIWECESTSSSSTPQALVDPFVENVTHGDFSFTIQLLTQVMTSQFNRKVNSPMNTHVNFASSRVSGFSRINPLEFYGFKLKEDP